MSKKYEEMMVKELREESRKRGLTLEHKGRKFTKSELIERIRNNDVDLIEEDDKHDIQKAIDEAGQPEPMNDDNEAWGEDTKPEKPEGYIQFATTLNEIEEKYGNRKKQTIYDNELKAGSLVVFIHYVEAKDGNIYKKLRTAKVVGVNRKKELVRVVTLLGTELELSFSQLLYIRGYGKYSTYPKDITTYLKGQRTEKGKVLINERLAESESDVTD